VRCAIVQDYQVVSVQDLSEEQFAATARTAQAVVSIEGMVPEPGVGWMMSGSKLVPPLGTDETEMVCLQVYDPVMAFVRTFQRRFIGENIAWGITQQGKTRAVGELLRDVEYWMNKGSLYEAMQEIEKVRAKLLADPVLAASVAPFVTSTRLDAYRLKILQFLGMA